MSRTKGTVITIPALGVARWRSGFINKRELVRSFLRLLVNLRTSNLANTNSGRGRAGGLFYKGQTSKEVASQGRKADPNFEDPSALLGARQDFTESFLVT